MWLPLLLLLVLLPNYAYSQGTDTIGTIEVPQDWTTTDNDFINYVGRGIEP